MGRATLCPSRARPCCSVRATPERAGRRVLRIAAYGFETTLLASASIVGCFAPSRERRLDAGAMIGVVTLVAGVACRL